MITRQQINQLLTFKNGKYLITSCYLNLDRSKRSAQELKIQIKDLLQAAGHKWTQQTADHEQRESLRRDFQRIESFVLENHTPKEEKGIAIFSCDGQKFWQTYTLPRSPREVVTAESAPYIRPLTAILNEFHRYCTILVDRQHGQIFEMYMGEILDRSDVVDQIPRKVREGGYGGREERSLERHHDKGVKQHYQHLAAVAFELHKRDHFEWLILGGHKDVRQEFREQLHPYLQERIVGEFLAEPGKTPIHEVLRQTLPIESMLDRQHEEKLVDQLLQKAKAGDRAVTGLQPTLDALIRGGVHTLLVEDGFTKPGFYCEKCHYLTLSSQRCPHCSKLTKACSDIVDQAIEVALLRNCTVEHVYHRSPLREAGQIGALLRFPV